MRIETAFWLLIPTVVTSAMITSASLEQAIKQLPARHKIGLKAYAEYCLASDLQTGLSWYLPLGSAWAFFTLAAAVVGWLNHQGQQSAIALICMVMGLVFHCVVSGFAGNTLFQLRQGIRGVTEMEALFNRFERLHRTRTVVDILTLGATVWALAADIAMT